MPVLFNAIEAAKCIPNLFLRGHSPSPRALLLAAATLLLVPALHAQDRSAVRRVPPDYPPLAKRMKLGGTVQVVATVDPSGSVIKAESTSPMRLLVPAAIDDVKQWKFEKADGISTVVVTVKFDSPA